MDFQNIPESFAIRGTIAHSLSIDKITIIKDGLITVSKGKITSIGSTSPEKLKEFDKVFHLLPTQLLIPGFIDTHIHAAQFPNIGLGYDRPLLDWLDTYTYPLEKKYIETKFARTIYQQVVKQTLQCGTTTACYFATIHRESSELLGKITAKFGQRAFIGKVCMNINCPPDYCEITETSISETKEFINTIKSLGSELVKPIITPRFAVTCDMKLMQGLAQLVKENDLHVQTHVSENKSEVDFVNTLFPNCKNYTDVYEKAGLLTRKTILAHGVFLQPSEVEVLVQHGTSVAHCPVSNICLTSGIFPLRRYLNTGLQVGLGSDVSGGSAKSMIEVIRETISASTANYFTNANEKPINFHEAFYLATMGGAKALSLGDQIGNFIEGKFFDALIVDASPAGSPSLIFEGIELNSIELLQKFLYVGDDRNIIAVFVAGKEVKNH